MDWGTWKENIEDFLIRTIDVSQKYYFDGMMREIHLSTSVSYGDVKILILTDDTAFEVNYDEFKLATEEMERDKQRECYFEHECIWAEFFMDFNDDLATIQKCLLQICEKLKEHYGAEVLIEMREEL